MLTINEIFHSIQGESTHAGRPCVFVRLTACDLRCSWCDTPYAFHEGEKMTVEDVVGRVRDYGCDVVEITGGEPLLQPDDRLRPADEVKFVIKDRADYEYARAVVAKHELIGRCNAVLFSPVHGVQDAKQLAEWVLADRLAVRVQLQTHKYIWDATTRGV